LAGDSTYATFDLTGENLLSQLLEAML